MQFEAPFAFLSESDRLKSVDRASVLMDGSRLENSAEHSWHVALYAMVFGAPDRAIAMILLHDLVEIDVGDHPIHLDHDWDALAAAEDAAARRLFGLWPGGGALLDLWREFESGLSPDAQAAKRMDHVQPLFQVLLAAQPLPDHLGIVRDNMGGGRAARLYHEWPEAMAAAEDLLAGRAVPGEFGARLAFLAQADRLKSVLRSGLIHSGRRENSAEHSWHLGLYALVLGGLAPGLDLGRVIRMLILHDLVEVDVGDVPFHAANGQAHHSTARVAQEQAAATRLFGLLPPTQAAEFRALWDEFETAATPEAVFANALDRVQPVWLNIMAGGGTWVEFGVGWDQLQSRVGPRIARATPALWDWLSDRARGCFAAAR